MALALTVGPRPLGCQTQRCGVGRLVPCVSLLTRTGCSGCHTRIFAGTPRDCSSWGAFRVHRAVHILFHWRASVKASCKEIPALPHSRWATFTPRHWGSTRGARCVRKRQCVATSRSREPERCWLTLSRRRSHAERRLGSLYAKRSTAPPRRRPTAAAARVAPRAGGAPCVIGCENRENSKPALADSLRTKGFTGEKRKAVKSALSSTKLFPTQGKADEGDCDRVLD